MKTLIFMTTAALSVTVWASAFAATDGTSTQPPQTVVGSPGTVAPGSTVTASKGPADPDRIVCKTVDVTGSHLGSKRACRTRAAWDEMTRASREATDKFQNSDTGTNIPTAPH